MTIKFWMWNFYCREILLSWRRLLILSVENKQNPTIVLDSGGSSDSGKTRRIWPSPAERSFQFEDSLCSDPLFHSRQRLIFRGIVGLFLESWPHSCKSQGRLFPNSFLLSGHGGPMCGVGATSLNIKLVRQACLVKLASGDFKPSAGSWLMRWLLLPSRTRTWVLKLPDAVTVQLGEPFLEFPYNLRGLYPAIWMHSSHDLPQCIQYPIKRGNSAFWWPLQGVLCKSKC